MKRIVLLLAAACMGVAAYSATITDELTAASLAATGSGYTDFKGVTYASEAVYAGNTATTYGAIQIRSKSSDSGIVTTVSGGTLMSVTVEWNQNTMAGRALQVYGSHTPYVSATDLYADDTCGTLIGSIVYGDASTTLNVGEAYEYVGLRSAEGALYVEKIEVDWSTGGEALARPVITPKSGVIAAGTLVTIEAEGAEAIRYTTDGSAPTAKSALYEGPFAVSEACAVKAVAFSGSTVSPVAEESYIIAPLVSSLAEAKSMELGEVFEVGFSPCVTYSYGANTYIYDDLEYGLIRAYGLGLKAGDVVASGWLARLEEYNKTIELVPVSAISADGHAALPVPVGITEGNFDELFTSTSQAMYVTAWPVTFAEPTPGPDADSRYCTAMLGANELTVSNLFDRPSEGTGTYAVTGIVTLNGTLVQLSPTAFTAMDDVAVAMPEFSVASKWVEPGTEIAITCATAGAETHYTTDGTTPTAKSAVYTGPIAVTRDMAISAVAVSGGERSQAVRAIYKVTGGGESHPGTAVVAAPELAAGADVALVNNDGSKKCADSTKEECSLVGKEFTVSADGEEVLTLEFVHGKNNYFSAAFGDEVRWYNDDRLEVTPAYGVTIESMRFATVANSKGAFTASEGTVDGTGVGAANPLTWEGGCSSKLTLHAEAQVRFSTITITYSSPSGVEGVEADSEAPAEYYNLQGVRIARPAAGQVVIERRGPAVRKMVVR